MEEFGNQDKVKEKLKFNTEILRLTVVGILTIGGGTVTLIDQGVFSGKRNFIIAFGFVLLIVLSKLLYQAVKTITKTIR